MHVLERLAAAAAAHGSPKDKSRSLVKEASFLLERSMTLITGIDDADVSSSLHSVFQPVSGSEQIEGEWGARCEVSSRGGAIMYV